MNNNKTPEQRIADSILQSKISVKVGGKSFDVRPPTLATLYRFSAIVSQLSYVDFGEMSDNMQDVISSVIMNAECAPVYAEALAVLILGARKDGYSEEVETNDTIMKKSLFGLCKTEKAIEGTKRIDRLEELKSFLLYSGSPQEIQVALVEILSKNSEAAYFFSTGNFLKGANLLKPTKQK